MNSEKKRIIVVLGMHRSGTSVITRGLKILGVKLGDNLLSAAPDNEKGFWEDEDIHKLNEAILNRINSTWYNVAYIDSSVFREYDLESEKEKAIKLINKKINNSNYFGFKDPRTSILLPFWMDVFKFLNFDDNYIISLRNPLSVADSIYLRDGMSKEKSYLVWLKYYLCALRDTKDRPRIVVEFDLLLDSPLLQFTRISNALRIHDYGNDDKEIDEYITNFISKDLRHNRSDNHELGKNSSIPEFIRSAYITLSQLARDEITFENKSFINSWNKINKVYHEFIPVYSYIDKKEIQLRNAYNSNVKLNNEKDIIEAELYNTTEYKDAAIIERDAAIIERDAIRKEAQGIQNKVDSILNSNSWKFTKIFRSIRRTSFSTLFNDFNIKMLRDVLNKLYRGRYVKKDRNIILASSLFESIWYLNVNPDVAESGMDPLEHFLIYGAREGRDPSPLFNTKYYLSQIPELASSPVNPLAHYLRIGWQEGKNPNPIFDSQWYLSQVPVNELGDRSPLQHYLEQSTPYSHDPSPSFSNTEYLDANPDVKTAGFNPAWHFLSSGHIERFKFSGTSESSLTNDTNNDFVNYHIDKTAVLDAKDNILIYVAYCPSGILSDLQLATINSYVNKGYKVVLIVNSGNYLHRESPGDTPAIIQIVRDNIGFDFGAWAHACRLIGGLDQVNSVTFTNDSLVGPLSHNDSAIPNSVHRLDADIVFLTRNTEIKSHMQSYFFAVKKSALNNRALDIIRQLPYISDKNELIQNVELSLSDNFEKNNFEVATLYPCHQADKKNKNPTIHYWKELIDKGFPFFKIQIITAGFVSIDDPVLIATLGNDLVTKLRDHVSQRKITYIPRLQDPNLPTKPALPTTALFGPHNALQAYNPPANQMPIFAVPLEGVGRISTNPIDETRILAIIHCYYLDVAKDILTEIAALKLKLRLVLTTDSTKKAKLLDSMLHKRSLNGEVVVTPNRGRDVAPFLVEGSKRIHNSDVVLHIHTKKSKHDKRYKDWGRFLRKNLIGSREIAQSILCLLNENEIGIVYSDHLPEVRDLRNWGYDFDAARCLMERIGIAISSEELLEFPTSSMFWAKVDALRPLFALGLDYDNFEEESGQIDGTLAHAIERCLLTIAESQGYRHVSVLEKDNSESQKAMTINYQRIKYALRRLAPRLLGSMGTQPFFYSSVNEVYPVNIAKSSRTERRLNVLIPTMKPDKIYGGITSAIHCVKALIDSLSDTNIRLIITSDNVDPESLQEINKQFNITVILAEPNDDVNGHVVVDLYSRRHMPLALRSGDIFFATAWWTADLAFRLHDKQDEMHGSTSNIMYLIQDYEPGFYPWSEKYALADATYTRSEDTIAIINSEELTNFIIKRHSFNYICHIPFELNPVLKAKLKPTIKMKKIIVYGRPKVVRNLFNTIVEGLRIWQARNPNKNTTYEILFAGENFNAVHLSELENAHMVGKLSLDKYAELLNEAAIGISLMMSPHPSYPPLEMASANCITITNAYECKDLSIRAHNIISLDTVTPGNIAGALSVAVEKVDLSKLTYPIDIKAISTDAPAVDYNNIAVILQR